MPLPTATTALHSAYKLALLPVALVAIERGDFPKLRPMHAENLAHAAAFDLVMRGKTLMLSMDEVAEVLPEFGRVVAYPTAAERSRIYAGLVGAPLSIAAE